MKKVLLFVSACLFAFAASADPIVIETTGEDGVSTAEYPLENFSIDKGGVFVLTVDGTTSEALSKIQVNVFKEDANLFDWGNSSLNGWNTVDANGSISATVFLTSLLAAEAGAEYSLQFIAGADATTLTFTTLTWEVKPAGTIWFGEESVVAWNQLSKSLATSDIPAEGYIAVSYTGSTPTMNLQTSSDWFQWGSVSPDLDYEGVAYFSKASIDEAWSAYQAEQETDYAYSQGLLSAGADGTTFTNICVVAELPSVKNKIVMNANETYNYQSAGIALGLSEAPAIGDTVVLNLTNVTISNDVDAIQVFLVEQGADNSWDWNVVSNYAVAMESPKASDDAVAEVKVKVIIENAITYPGIVSAYVATTTAPVESVESVTLFYDEKGVTVIDGPEDEEGGEGEETAVEDVNASSFAVEGGMVYSAGEIVVYNVAGAVVATANHEFNLFYLDYGVYFITAPEGTIKFVK